MPFRPRWLAAPVFILVALLATPLTPTSAQSDPFDAEISKAQDQVASTRAQAHAASARLESAAAQRQAVEARVVAVEARVAELAIQIPALKSQIEELRRVLETRAVALYSIGGPAALYGPISFTPSLKAVRRRILADAAARQDNATVKKIEGVLVQLSEAERQLAVEKSTLAAQQAELVQLEASLAAQQVELDRRVAAANAALERAQALGALRARGEPMLGPTILTAAQMAAWVRAKKYRTNLQTSIEDLAAIYVSEGTSEGLRGDLAFAQSVIETGGFASAPDNNFAGLGWCDSCAYGTRFPTPRDGVRAQVQHLKNYADKTSRAANLAHPPSPYWYSADPVSAARKFDTFFAKGWAPTWTDMGSGNWATDRNYSGKVLKVYADMVAFARTGSL